MIYRKYGGKHQKRILLNRRADFVTQELSKSSKLMGENAIRHSGDISFDMNIYSPKLFVSRDCKFNNKTNNNNNDKEVTKTATTAVITITTKNNEDDSILVVIILMMTQ